MNSIVILGHFGANKKILDGQTIKTRILYDELSKYTDWSIRTIDTFHKKKRPLFLLFKSIVSFINTRDVIILLSLGGLKVYLPILYFFSKVFHSRIYHSIIGGDMDKYVLSYPKFRKYLNSFVVNWAETDSLKNELEKVGIVNSETLPNFKCLKIISEEEIDSEQYRKPYQLCIFSRVMRKKGIEDAVNAVKNVNEVSGEPVYTLDIYGQVDLEEREWFDSLQKSFPSYIRYGGEIPYDKSTEVLKPYFALLFPTRFYLEGVPGTVIDAYAAGVPVISSRWKSFEDVIIDGVTGLGYEFGNVEELSKILFGIKDDPEKIRCMKRACLLEAKKYLPEENIMKIIEKVKNR